MTQTADPRVLAERARATTDTATAGKAEALKAQQKATAAREKAEAAEFEAEEAAQQATRSAVADLIMAMEELAAQARDGFAAAVTALATDPAAVPGLWMQAHMHRATLRGRAEGLFEAIKALDPAMRMPGGRHWGPGIERDDSLSPPDNKGESYSEWLSRNVAPLLRYRRQQARDEQRAALGAP